MPAPAAEAAAAAAAAAELLTPCPSDNRCELAPRDTTVCFVTLVSNGHVRSPRGSCVPPLLNVLLLPLTPAALLVVLPRGEMRVV